MGKKIRPKSILSTEPSSSPALDGFKTTNENVLDNEVETVEIAALGAGRKTSEDQSKLDRYNELEKTVADLQREKTQLEEKVTEYIERLSTCSKDNAEVSKLEAENAELKTKLKTANDDLAKCKRDAKSARDEADDYLVKISELAFENAKLTAEINDLKSRTQADSSKPSSNKSDNSIAERTAQNQKQFAPQPNVPQQGNSYMAKARRDVYNAYANNGYGTW